MNQIWIVSSIFLDGATQKILVLRVSWFARKLIHRQMDISVFFPMKKALKIYKTVSLVLMESEVDLDFRGHSKHGSSVGMSAVDSLTLKT